MAALPTLKHLPTLQDQLPIVRQLAGSALAIAIIGMLEATAITKTLAARSGQHLDPNQELMGMGVGNLAAGLFGLTPGSSSFTRSAVNYQSGAVSQLSSMLSSVTVLLISLFLTPLFNYIPVAALAAHLVRLGYKLINRSQIRVSTRFHPFGRRRILRDPGSRPFSQARHRHLRGHWCGAGVVSAKNDRAYPGRIYLQ